MIFFGLRSLERALREYVDHYHSERNHQGIGNTLIARNPTTNSPAGDVCVHVRLGGLLKYYHRAAA